jgi:hypothetical protein
VLRNSGQLLHRNLSQESFSDIMSHPIPTGMEAAYPDEYVVVAKETNRFLASRLEKGGPPATPDTR